MRPSSASAACAFFVGLACLAEPAQATLLVNGGAELGSLSGWTLTPAGAPAGSVTSRSQSTGTVLPFEGSRFFTFANGAHPGPMVLSQTDSGGLGVKWIVLNGAFQTEFNDPAEVVLSILDGSANVLASVSTGLITTPNLTWLALPQLVLKTPDGAVSWSVELRGYLSFGTFVNVHYDALTLERVPAPAAGTLLLAAALLWPLLRRASARGEGAA